MVSQSLKFTILYTSNYFFYYNLSPKKKSKIYSFFTVQNILTHNTLRVIELSGIFFCTLQAEVTFWYGISVCKVVTVMFMAKYLPERNLCWQGNFFAQLCVMPK